MAKPRIGDIVEVSVGVGLAYALYTHEHDQFGSLLRVFGRIFSTRPNSFEQLVDVCPRFETFFPLAAAVRKKIVTLVANVPIPFHLRTFPIFRDGVANATTGKVETWWLWDGEKEWPVGSISEEQRKLPLRAVINDTLLRERILNGWTAECDPQ